eukprot:978271-Prorocentrum_minimum.AAC.1
MTFSIFHWEKTIPKNVIVDSYVDKIYIRSGRMKCLRLNVGPWKLLAVCRVARVFLRDSTEASTEAADDRISMRHGEMRCKALPARRRPRDGGRTLKPRERV